MITRISHIDISILAGALLWLLSGCASPQAEFARRAADAGVMTTDVRTAHFTHRIYTRPSNQVSDIALVFIEGDSAWDNDRPVYVYNPDKHRSGIVYTRKPVDDPTPRHPLAFNLMLQTAWPAWYVTRPCYNGLRDILCNAHLWTDERYSTQVVASMASAINQYASTQPQRRLVLVGYSGGGTLAVLLASHLPQAVGVITIAANLDIQAWTEALRFTPLLGSLNPATELQPSIMPHVALVGDADRQVPFSTIARFLNAQPHTQVMHYADYDHVCCWETNWPALLATALAQLNIDANTPH